MSPDTFFARGAAAVTLIEALERAGYRVQVDMISLAIADTLGTQKVRLACRIKEAGEVVQLDKLAFCLAHPALHRKLNFSLRLKHAGWIGGSIDVPVEERGDIYIDAADSTATSAWLDPVKAQEWCWPIRGGAEAVHGWRSDALRSQAHQRDRGLPLSKAGDGCKQPPAFLGWFWWVVAADGDRAVPRSNSNGAAGQASGGQTEGRVAGNLPLGHRGTAAALRPTQFHRAVDLPRSAG